MEESICNTSHNMKTVNSSISYVTDNSVIETFKLMILLGKKDTMTDDAFADYWLTHHAPLAKKMPGLRKYVVNVVKRPPNREPEYNGVVELWFDDKDAMKAAFASPEGQATQRDTEKFTNKLTTMFIEEHSIT